MRLLSQNLIFGWLLALITVAGCAVSAPVQEMSNARQTIQAAKEAGADQYAPELLSIAEKLLDRAAHKLKEKDFHVARNFAVEAQQQAMLARQKALDKTGNRPQND